MPKTLLGFLFTLFLSNQAHAYDPCQTQGTIHALAYSECHRILIDDPEINEQFVLSAVELTEESRTSHFKDTVILIPGGPGSDSQSIAMSLNQKEILNAFWKHLNLNVVLYDPRGTGASKLSQEIHLYSPEAIRTQKQVSDLKVLADRLSPDKPVLLFAHSAGGNTAAKYAALYPERVKALILYSASIDTREIGQTNLRLFADRFEYWESYKQVCQNADLIEDFSSIESFLRDAIKVQRLTDKKTSLLSSFYPKSFRAELTRAIENDSSCTGRVPEAIEKWKGMIDELPQNVISAVRNAGSLSFDPQAHRPPRLKRSSWYKTAIICSEGLTKKEMESALWLDGLNFSDDTCSGVKAKYDSPPSREWLKSISAPTLLIGGLEDERQIPSAVQRNAGAIKNSQLLLIPSAGHEAHISHPWLVYTTIRDFIWSL